MRSISAFIFLIILLQQNLLYPQWAMINSPNATPDVRNVVSHPDGYLITITAENEVFRSDTIIENWERISTVSDEIKCLAVTPQGTIYAGITTGYLQSIDGGVTWTKKQLFSNVSHVSDIEVLDNGKLFMVQSCQDYPEYNRVWISSTNGSLWTYFNHGLIGEELLKLTKDSNEDLYLLARTGTIYKSTNQAYSWQMISQLYLTSFDLECDSSNYLYAATSNYIYISRDLGVTWNIIYFGWAYNIAIGCNSLIYAHNINKIIYTTSGGYSLWSDLGLMGTAIYDIIEVDNTVYVASGTSSVSTYLNAKGLQSTNNLGTNWNTCFRYSDRYLRVNDVLSFDDKIIISSKDGLYLSPDNGNSWDTVLVGNMNLIKIDNSLNLYATSSITYQSNGVLYRSTNKGVNWEECINGIINFFINDSNYIFATASGPVFKSTNYGYWWQTLFYGAPYISEIRSISQNSSGSIFISTYHRFYMPGYGNIYTILLLRTDNNGENWTQVRGDLLISDIIFKDSLMYLVTPNDGIYKSTNNGVNIIPIKSGLTSWKIRKFIITPDEQLICATENGIHVSNNHGNYWERLDHSGLLSSDVYSIFYNDETLYASTKNGIGVFLGNLVSVEDDPSENNPAKHTLSQNYPNPFNPTTKISYTLPHSEIVKIKVYNVLGKEIKTLVNEFKSVGKYELEFDASNLPSGVYFYRIQSGSFIETKKMILLR